MSPSRKISTLAFAFASLIVATSAQATDVTGAGSSFIYPILSKWSAAYAEKTGNHVNYQSIGSGGGIAQIKAGTVDFGASDKPRSDEDLTSFGLGQFPSVIGGIVPVLNVEGIPTGSLVLDGSTLANIFLGKITTWNDPAIAQMHPHMSLPKATLTVVHRSDGSGTTFNFTNFLSKVNPDWKANVGEGTAVKWPLGIGGKGNEGVAAYVKQLKGSIGYVEYAYALRNDIAYTSMKNATGSTVKPGSAAFQAAAATADWINAKDFNLIMTNAPGAAAWPITATTWVIMAKRAKNPANARVVLDFFRWSLENGREQAASLDYVPLPPTLVEQIEANWQSPFAM